MIPAKPDHPLRFLRRLDHVVQCLEEQEFLSRFAREDSLLRPEEDELEAFDLFADRIRTVHLKDRLLTRRHEGDTPFVCADGKSVYACAVGSGFIRIAEILARLKQRGYSGNVIAELYACDPHHVLQDAADSVRWLKERI